MLAKRQRWTRLAAVCGILVLAPVVGWGAYAAVTWLSFGQQWSTPGSDPLMRRYMPRYDIAEVHRTRVAAPASVAFDAGRRRTCSDRAWSTRSSAAARSCSARRRRRGRRTTRW
jgi:hypothetical protein